MLARSRCAYCRKRVEEPPYRPFCSERCKRADLGRWLSGDYRIASEPVHEMDLDASEDASEDPPQHHH